MRHGKLEIQLVMPHFSLGVTAVRKLLIISSKQRCCSGDTKLLEIGHRLCTQRKKKGLTQDALAEKANVSAQTISHAELGKKAKSQPGSNLDIRKIIHCAGKSKRLCFGSFGVFLVLYFYGVGRETTFISAVSGLI